MTLPLQNALRKLSAYENVSYPILSLYINTFRKDHPDMLKNFRHLVVDYLSDEEQEVVKKNISYIMGFLETFPTPQDCQTVAIFSGGDNLWEVITTDLHIAEQIQVSHSPFVKPLLKTLTKNQRYLIVLADKDRALFLKMHDGEITDRKEIKENIFSNEVPDKLRGRNKDMRSGQEDQHARDHLHKHFQKIGKETCHFLEEDDIAGVLIGSHQQLIRPIEDNFTKEAKEKIIGEFIADLKAPLPELLQQSTTILTQHLEGQVSSYLLHH